MTVGFIGFLSLQVLLERKEISGEEIDFILNKYPPQTPLKLLLGEENPGSLKFVTQEQDRNRNSSQSTPLYLNPMEKPDD